MNNLDEMLNKTPVLTLDGLDSGSEESPAAALAEVTSESSASVADSVESMKAELTPEEQKMVSDFASTIDITNTQQVMQYGAGCQKKIADFSETALANVRTKDMGEIGELLSGMVGELKGFDEEPEKGLFGIFKKGGNKLASIKSKYEKAEVNISKVSTALKQHQVTLLKDIALLDKMYELNLNYFKELSMYILAGKEKLKTAREVELPQYVEKAEKTGLPEDAQKSRDFSQMLTRFEKKIHDLELTRMVALQMAPQIRLIQGNDVIMSDKIQSTLVNTIPLWKSQMVIAIGLAHSTEAAKTQRSVSDFTNEMLKRNAEALKLATVETARESERGIVDIEALTATNQTLISTLDEVMKIQQEGRDKRLAAEVELARIEGEMKNKLLELSRIKQDDGSSAEVVG
mgnify:FL=1